MNWFRIFKVWNRLMALEADAALRFVKQDKRIMQLEERNRLAWERIAAFEQQQGEISRKQAELQAILIEVRQLRELLTDPKRTPVIAKTFHQYRALMEAE